MKKIVVDRSGNSEDVGLLKICSLYLCGFNDYQVIISLDSKLPDSLIVFVALFSCFLKLSISMFHEQVALINTIFHPIDSSIFLVELVS